MHRLRFLTFFVVAAMLLAACGMKVPVRQVARTVAEGESTGETEVLGEQIEGTTDTGVPVVGTTTTKKTTTKATPKPGTTTTTTTTGLFDNETQGLTASEIKLCTHAPITGAAPIARKPEQFSLYWDYVNRQGGINGRKIKALIFDDTYKPEGAIAVANRCKAEGSFAMLGAAGVDQITVVADFAKANKIPYLHGSASTQSIGTNPYQFFLSPDYENQHKLLARYVVNALGKKKVAQIRLDSPHFKEGAETFKRELERLGGQLVADITVANDQQSFAGIVGDLKDAEVVNNFTNPLTWLKMIQQLFQQIQPIWTAVSPAAGQNLIVGQLGALVGPGNIQVFYGYPIFRLDACLNHCDEINTFLQAFTDVTGKPKAEADDVDFLSWALAKQLGDLLKAAGPNLSRSKLVQTIEGYTQTVEQAAPLCPLDFPRDSAKRVGAWHVNVFRSLSNGKWEQIHTCKNDF